ncbi:MAG: hypothetical protein JXO51_02665 [Candidatus Aminicenantes bacterium]|nr:hypothetical protein [Candidatus Aminicenantes bacterium]
MSSPVAGLLFPVAFVGTLFGAGIVSLADPLVARGSMVYFAGGILAMLVFMAVAQAAGSCFRPGAAERKGRVFSALRLLPAARWLGLLGGGFIALDLFLSIPYRELDLVAIRQGFAQRQPTLFAYPGNLLAPCALMALGLTLLYYERIHPLKRLAGLFVGLGVPIMTALGLGGRNYIFDLLVMVPWWLLQRPLRRAPVVPRRFSWRVLAPAAALLLFVALALISMMRSPEGADQYEAVILLNRDAVTLEPRLQEKLRALRPELATILSEAFFYWSAAVPTFDKVYAHWRLPPTWLSPFSPLLHRRLSAWGIAPSSEQVTEHYGRIVWPYGIWPNGFSTASKDMIVALGRAGGLLAQALLGLAAGLLFVLSRKRCDFMMSFLSSVFFLVFFLWFQGGTLGHPLYEYALYYGIVYLLLRRWFMFSFSPSLDERQH